MRIVIQQRRSSITGLMVISFMAMAFIYLIPLISHFAHKAIRTADFMKRLDTPFPGETFRRGDVVLRTAMSFTESLRGISASQKQRAQYATGTNDSDLYVLYVYVNQPPHSSKATVIIPGYEIVRIRYSWQPIRFLDVRDRVYEYMIAVRKPAYVTWYPQHLQVVLICGRIPSYIETTINPLGKLPGATTVLYSNDWSHHSTRISQMGRKIPQLPSPKKWNWLGIISNGQGPKIKSIDFLPNPVLQDALSGEHEKYASIAAWLPGALKGGTISCIIHYDDGRQKIIHLRQGMQRVGMKLVWELPVSLQEKLPATDF